jgi:hypothetical protein
MVMKHPRAWVVAMAVAGLVVSAAASPASAGGYTPLRPDREFYRPGQTVRVSQEEVTKASHEWRGPYRVTLVRMGSQPVGVAAAGPVRDRYVGDLRIERWSERYVRASLTFTMPGLADGEYGLQVCNPGCAETLDLWGSVFVGHAPPRWPEPAAAPPPLPRTTAHPTTVPVPASVAAPAPAPAVLTGGGPEETGGLRPDPELSAAEWLVTAGFALLIVGWAFFGNGELLRRSRREVHEGPVLPPIIGE